MKYSINEINYIQESIIQNLRPDLRSLLENRTTKVCKIENSHSDGSLELRRGYSHIRLNVEFNIEKEIHSNFHIPQFYLKELEKLPNLGISIFLEIYKDDGNVTDLFFEGLKKIFEKIEIPEILYENETVQVNTLEESIFISLDLPEVSTFAIYNDVIIKDPIKLEEESCDALLTVFSKNKNVLSILMTKSGEITFEIIKEILKNI